MEKNPINSIFRTLQFLFFLKKTLLKHLLVTNVQFSEVLLLFNQRFHCINIWHKNLLKRMTKSHLPPLQGHILIKFKSIFNYF